jgi:hypothetical protein
MPFDMPFGFHAKHIHNYDLKIKEWGMVVTPLLVLRTP